MDLKIAKSILVGQAVNERLLDDKVSALQAANLLPGDDETPLSSRQVVSLLLATALTDPATVADYAGLKNSAGETFGDALVRILSKEPLLIRVQCVIICLTVPWITIKHLNGTMLDFHGEDIQPHLIRAEVVLSGALIDHIAKVKQENTRSRWAIHTS